jgi:hypothetical protein
VEYTEHFKAFIQTLDVDDEGFKEDLKKCYALCSYRLDKALRPEAEPELPKAEPAPKAETKAEPETKAETKEETKMTGGSHIPACMTSIRLKTIASRKREEVMKQILL